MKSVALGVLCAVLAGCGTDYRWRSPVPAEVRTVNVPTFRNETDVMELGAIAARQVSREFQREGTFRICSEGEAALEIQGVVKSALTAINAVDRTSRRVNASLCTAEVEVSVIDKRTNRVLIDNRRYEARTEMTTSQDMTTARRDASGRLMDDLARQVVDDILKLKW